MLSRRQTVIVLSALGLFASLVACGSSSSDDAGGGASVGKGGSGGTMLLDGSPMDVNTNSDAPYDGPTCGAESHKGETYPLDMYVMMDQSGSMISGKIDAANTISKWKAVTDGLSSFFQNIATSKEDIGAGIQFFPLPIVPISSLTKCQQGVQCSGGNQCLHTGDQWICVKPCTTSAECGSAECVDAGVMICANDSCNAADYAKPEVAIGPIASTKDAVLAAMAGHTPMLYTPTGPALTGAIQYAQSYAPAHKDRKVIVVLATDGQPTECPATLTTPQLVDQVKQVAANGLAGTPSIETFVVGVVKFGDAEATASLHAIAAAGGTKEAVVLEPQQDLAAKFAEALVKIKGDALSCEYKIPVGDGGKPDLGKVNVNYKINSGNTQTVYHVQDASKCDATLGGWYYDSATDPKSIKLCPATCAEFHKAGQTVDLGIQIGCLTQNMPPK